ncbi:hypothetical protein [Actinomycetospora sp. TBRC 11914]|uniref:hypothetical protein n=1 Tax=Actinomycetospora sp. TBRC 11914 TaxID=2729387 RepID=UPI00145C8464|nr:hypothetical protein [Actinomycetospora sp. TBRC 11914]NMO94086.1 hypothetical protein [Actinomycetospora sp. TBRC 11914]
MPGEENRTQQDGPTRRTRAPGNWRRRPSVTTLVVMGEEQDLASLTAVCAELNFRHSLVHDAFVLRAGVVAALTRNAVVLAELASSLRARAELTRSGRDRDRLLAAATRVDMRADASRRRCEELTAWAIGPPRPVVPSDPDAVSS